MRSIKSRDTGPELYIRKTLFKLGYRYRLKLPRLPGRPDILFSSRKKVIFVHGCFWHVHKDCAISHIPDKEIWRLKLQRNQERDAAALAALKQMGWDYLVVWECELKNTASIERKLTEFLGRPRVLLRA